MNRPLLVLSSFVLACVVAAACSDDANPPAASDQGSSPPPVGTGTSSPANDAAIVDAAVDAEPVGPALCEGIEQRSQEVAEIGLYGPAPAPAGGKLALGRYVLNELIQYGKDANTDASDPPAPGPTGFVARSTLIVSEKNVRFLGADGSSDAALPADSARASAYVLEGNNLKLTKQCGDGEATEAIGFTTTDATLTIHLPDERTATYRLDRF